MYWDPFRILLVLFFCAVAILCIGQGVIEAIGEHKAKKLEKQNKIQ